MNMGEGIDSKEKDSDWKSLWAYPTTDSESISGKKYYFHLALRELVCV